MNVPCQDILMTYIIYGSALFSFWVSSKCLNQNLYISTGQLLKVASLALNPLTNPYLVGVQISKMLWNNSSDALLSLCTCSSAIL